MFLPHHDMFSNCGTDKQQIQLSQRSRQEVKETTKKLGNGQLLSCQSGCGFVQNIAPPSLSRDRRIKMEHTNKQTIPVAYMNNLPE